MLALILSICADLAALIIAAPKLCAIFKKASWHKLILYIDGALGALIATLKKSFDITSCDAPHLKKT
jgi:hypothetical protein